jgi:hypothetical protein
LELQKKGVRTKPRRLREDLSASAEEIILGGLLFAPGARYKHASEFGNSLADALLASSMPQEKEAGVRIGWAPLLFLIGVVLISFSVYKVRGWRIKPEGNRSFDYFLTVQRMRGEQPYGEPVRSHGEETYNNGDKFRLTVLTPVPAYLYIFNEKPPQTGDASFTLVFPNQATDKGSASVGGKQSVQSNWFRFTDQAGAENFWLVWSTSPVSELDVATREAANNPEGAITGQTLVAVKQYLVAKQAEIKAITYNYNDNQTAVVRARRDLLVTLAEFKHR